MLDADALVLLVDSVSTDATDVELAAELSGVVMKVKSGVVIAWDAGVETDVTEAELAAELTVTRVTLGNVTSCDSALETVEDAGVSGRSKELDIPVDFVDGVAFRTDDDVLATLVVEFVTSVVEADSIATVEDGNMLTVGMVVLSLRVNDREMEIEAVDAVEDAESVESTEDTELPGTEGMCALELTTADDEADKVADFKSVIEKVIRDEDSVDASPSADAEEPASEDVVGVVAMLLVFAKL